MGNSSNYKRVLDHSASADRDSIYHPLGFWSSPPRILDVLSWYLNKETTWKKDLVQWALPAAIFFFKIETPWDLGEDLNLFVKVFRFLPEHAWVFASKGQFTRPDL